MASRRYAPPKEGKMVTVKHDGKEISAYEGEPLAAALLAAGVKVLSRSSKYHRPRGASCGKGDCAQCLVTIDGLPNRCACTTPCREGMVSQSQNVLGSAKNDLLGVTDWMFPWGLDHHEMFTGVPLVQPVVQKFVRKLSGLGSLHNESESIDSLKESPKPPKSSNDPISVDILIVGAGSSGIAAAKKAAGEGRKVLLLESRNYIGGRLSSGIHQAPTDLDISISMLREAGVELWTNSYAVQADRGNSCLEVLVLQADRLAKVLPKVAVMATGGYGATGVFENNDLPGVLAAEWAARLITKWGVLPGERPLICADEPHASAIANLFTEAGASPIKTIPLLAAYAPLCSAPPAVRLVAAKGGKQVEKVIVESDEFSESLSCDLIVVASPPAPAFELALEAGAEAKYEPRSGGFAIVTDPSGRTASKDLLACGTITGPCSVEVAIEMGERAASSAIELLESSIKVDTTKSLERRHAP